MSALSNLAGGNLLANVLGFNSLTAGLKDGNRMKKAQLEVTSYHQWVQQTTFIQQEQREKVDKTITTFPTFDCARTIVGAPAPGYIQHEKS